MKWLLKFIPHQMLIAYLCGLIKDAFTSKTLTVVDDEAVDKVLEPALNSWWSCAINPDISWQQTALANGLLVVDFLDKSGLETLENHLKLRQDSLKIGKEPRATLPPGEGYYNAK